MTELTSFNLSDQALGAVMMALQRSLMDQSDIVPVLKGPGLCSNRRRSCGEEPSNCQARRKRYGTLDEEDGKPSC